MMSMDRSIIGNCEHDEACAVHQDIGGIAGCGAGAMEGLNSGLYSRGGMGGASMKTASFW